MTDPGQLIPARPARVAHSIVRMERPVPEVSRFLYTAVGGPWYWIDRLPWSYRDWQRHLARGGMETWILSVEGTPAGYFELEPPSEGSVEIAAFGLLPAFVGLGLGGTLLTRAVRRAWDSGASRVWLHTCSLDHPNALRAYQARGFRVFRRTETERQLPAEPPGPW